MPVSVRARGIFQKQQCALRLTPHINNNVADVASWVLIERHRIPDVGGIELFVCPNCIAKKKTLPSPGNWTIVGPP
jgi:hypothetical protein